MKPYLLLVAILYCYSSKANCLLKKVSIDQRTQNSQLIVNGEIKSQRSCWNFEKTSIYTVSTVEVLNYLKGDAPTTIEIVTPGGELDGKLIVVEPNAELKVGSRGFFFLKENTTALNYTSRAKKFEIYSLAQGFIEQDLTTNSYRDPFDQYQNINTVASLIGKTTGVEYRLNASASRLNVNNAVNNSGGTPITLSPSRITAGTGSILTITGSGFGTRTGAATIQFRDANSTSFTTYANIPDSTYILSWTNTEIKVIVPGASINRQGGAGTGLVNIIHSTGAIMPSTSPLTVVYNQFEYKKRRVVLINQNTLGGYTFTLNTNFNNNTAAKSSFTRALSQWKCNTGVNVNIATTTTTNACANQTDNINTISFADGSCALPAGTLGVTYSSYSLCSNSPIIPDGIDMIFSGSSSFYFGTDATPAGLYDFESVALHELGHAFGEGHNSEVTEIMFPSIGAGYSKRVLNSITDIENITDIMTRSTASSSCGYLKHVAVTTNCLSQSAPIAAAFSSDKIVGCAPLIVKFTDNSTGNPTQWRWDIDNNGSIDYNTQNPTHTFTNPGTYNVKFTAINATSNDSIVKIAQITVAPSLKANIEIGQQINCNGGNNATLISSGNGGNGIYTYTWNNNQTQSTATNLSAGTYTVTIKDGYGCSSTASKIIAQPDPILVNITTQTINSNQFNATLNVSGGTAPYTFLLNNNAISLVNSSINNLTAGNYAVIVKDKNNCIKSSSFTVSAATSIVDVENKFDALDIYPNPASNNVNINLSLKEYQDVNVALYDLSGQTIFEEQYKDIKDKQTNVDLSMLASGTYILKFGLAEGNTFRKVIVNR